MCLMARVGGVFYSTKLKTLERVVSAAGSSQGQQKRPEQTERVGRKTEYARKRESAGVGPWRDWVDTCEGWMKHMK